MKSVTYFLLITQTLAILFLLSIMNDRYFAKSDMRVSFETGCGLGQAYIFSKNFTCSKAAVEYKDNLDLIDALMDQYGRK